MVTLVDDSSSRTKEEVSLPTLADRNFDPKRELDLSCAYYVTFPDSNLSTLESKFMQRYLGIHFDFRKGDCESSRTVFLWTLSGGKIQKNKPAFPWGTK